MLSAIFVALTSQVGQDANLLYKEIQSRVGQAYGFSQRYTTGPDSWDTDVEILYDRSGKFRKGHKNYSLHCDGKWFLELDFGVVTHRPAKSNEIYYVPGLENLYPNCPPLEVYGNVEEVKPYNYSDYRVWKIHYRKAGKEESFLVDPATRLPLDITLLPFGTQVTPFSVPGFGKQADIVKQAQRALASAKSILLTRKIYDQGKQSTELILLYRNGKAYVSKVGVGKPYPIQYDPNGFQKSNPTGTWIDKAKPVLAKTLALPGFESFTGAKTPSVSGDAILDYADGSTREHRMMSSFAWNTTPKTGSWQEVRYGQLSFWPDSAYVWGSRQTGDRKEKILAKRLTYEIGIVNPNIMVSR